jgi:PTH2 family peptidyl-tRNA hydrolase
VTQGAHGAVKASLMASHGNIDADSGHPYPIERKKTPIAKEWQEWFQQWDQRAWNQGGYKKITLKVPSEADLKHVCASAYAQGLPSFLVRDAGLTQIPSGTWTACAIGPALTSLIDPLTKDLKLL